MQTTLRASLWVWSLVFLMLVSTSHAQNRDATEARNRMVDELIAPEGVKDERVLSAMRTVPRHQFVKTSLRPLAYTDQALDIGFKQTISPPFIVAYMTEILEPQPTDRVLEIGTGSGYQAAVLSGLVAEVYSIEIVEPLGVRARQLLKQLKYDNVQVKVGDGYQGWAEHAPFDKVIVTCSPESIPQPLIDQLKEGGKMIIPLGERYQQVFYLFEKQDGKLKETRLLPTLFVPMTGQAEDTRKVLPDPLNPRLTNTGFEEDVDENGQADGWHYHRRAQIDETDPYKGKRCLTFENSEPGRASHVLQAFAVDGTKVTGLEISARYKGSDFKQGSRSGEQPGIVIHFFDGRRIPLAQTVIGPWTSNSSWTSSSRKIQVPRDAREAIIQMGLNGATGELWVDDVGLSATRP